MEKELLRKVKEIQINSRKIVNNAMSGDYQSAFKGKGMEFDLVREYQEGDEQRSIDWNVTARMGHPFVKSYIEERELTLIFAVDISASENFGTSNQQKKELAAELCAVLAFNAIRKNDRVGLLLFSEDVELFIPPKKGSKHVLRIIRELLYFKPQKKGTNINVALEYLNKIIKKRAICFLVSDFFDDNYEKNLLVTSKRHDLIGIQVYDKAENQLSNLGLVEMKDQETEKQILADTSSKSWLDSFQRKRQRFDNELADLFKKSGVELMKLTTGENFVHQLILFFKKRSRAKF